MGDVIQLSDYVYTWKEAFSIDGPNSMLQVYIDSRTGAGEIVQMNDEGEVIRTPLCSNDVNVLAAVLRLKKGTAK